MPSFHMAIATNIKQNKLLRTQEQKPGNRSIYSNRAVTLFKTCIYYSNRVIMHVMQYLKLLTITLSLRIILRIMHMHVALTNDIPGNYILNRID